MKCLVLFLIVVMQHPVRPSPPSFLNYWDLSAELIRNQGFADAIEASPQQLQAIREMRTANKFSSRFYAEFSRQSASEQISNKREIALRAIDDEVKHVLAEILTENQVSYLYSVGIRCRFRSFEALFLDRQIQDFLGVARGEESEIFDKMLRATQKKIAEERLAVGKKLASKALLRFPEHSKQKMLAYVGDPAASIYRLNAPATEFQSIPFVPASRYTSAIFSIEQHPENLGLTKDGLQRLVDIRNQEFQAKAAHAPGVDMKKHSERIRDHYGALMRSELGSKMRKVAQHMSYERFCYQPSDVFERPEFVRFLDLTPQEIAELRVQIRNDEKAAFTKLWKVEERLYDDVVSELTVPQQAKLETILPREQLFNNEGFLVKR